MDFKVYTIKSMSTMVTLQFVDKRITEKIEYLDSLVVDIEKYLNEMEDKYSVFKEDSLVSQHRKLGNEAVDIIMDEEYQEIYTLCLFYQKQSEGLFNPFFDGAYNPTGLVKSYIIEKVFYKYLSPLVESGMIEAAAINCGGDMQVGVNQESDFTWNIGIENPTLNGKLLASYKIANGAVATSGNNKRGNHIVSKEEKYSFKQVSVVGNKVSEVDVWATSLMAADTETAEDIIRKEKLTTILIDINDEKIIYEEGEKIC
ncbi:MAG: FAD:protein FMN transferase [Gemella sp.]|nr:FAD:protein FMN transferase [Gemella sp.]